VVLPIGVRTRWDGTPGCSDRPEPARGAGCATQPKRAFTGAVWHWPAQVRRITGGLGRLGVLVCDEDLEDERSALWVPTVLDLCDEHGRPEGSLRSLKAQQVWRGGNRRADTALSSEPARGARCGTARLLAQNRRPSTACRHHRRSARIRYSQPTAPQKVTRTCHAARTAPAGQLHPVGATGVRRARSPVGQAATTSRNGHLDPVALADLGLPSGWGW